jgi:hypothetical protein
MVINWTKISASVAHRRFRWNKLRPIFAVQSVAYYVG